MFFQILIYVLVCISSAMHKFSDFSSEIFGSEARESPKRSPVFHIITQMQQVVTVYATFLGT